MTQKKLILIQFNEINFEIFYKNILNFKNLSKILDFKKIKTYSEDDFKLLEPWIQWVSVYTGKSASDHKIFRLGDTDKKNKQIFELLEENGFSVGSVCPMNASNKLKKPKFFLPDPWTETKADGNLLNKLIHEAISQTVNDNSKQKISIKSFFILTLSFLIFFSFNNLKIYILLFYKSIFLKKKWCKALFLDLFISDFFIKKLKKTKPNFSSVFFNAGAHIQHHYFFNMINEHKKNPSWYIKKNENPLNEMLSVYDKIFGNLLSLKDYEFIFSTGLSQIPAKKSKYYYRLNNHKEFLNKININYEKVLPRMTRDFAIYFKNENDLDNAFNILNSIETEDKIKLFGAIDKRSKSLFVTLTFPNEISLNTKFKSVFCEELNIHREVVFVAIKNGIHNSEGYVFASNDVIVKNTQMHIKDLFTVIKNFFLIDNKISYE